MTVPVRVTAPSAPVVVLSDLKAHLRVDGTDSDAMIEGLEKVAVAHLDGYRGILGRCIHSQEWSVTYDAAGTYRLPLPDVSAIVVSAGTAELETDCLGAKVTITEAATVKMTCALPADALDAIRHAIRLWVQKRFDGLTGPEGQAFDDAFDALVTPLRWTRV